MYSIYDYKHEFYSTFSIASAINEKLLHHFKLQNIKNLYQNYPNWNVNRWKKSQSYISKKTFKSNSTF